MIDRRSAHSLWQATIVLAFLTVSSVAMAAEDAAASPVAEAKEAVKDGAKAVGTTTRKVTRAIGHGTRDAAKAIGHGASDAAHGIGDAAKKAWNDTTNSESGTKKP